MTMKTSSGNKKKMMRGFMCLQSVGDIKACVPASGDQHIKSVIEPMRRRMQVSDNEGRQKLLIDHHRHSATLFRISDERSKSNIITADDQYRRRSVSLPLTSSEHVVSLVENKTHADGADYHRHKLEDTNNNTSNLASFQVVVLRVSLHCQGCAGKLKKHLSKMEGVTSFSIDLETKRVTVMGHVSPTGVLESISKVKRAEFWVC